MNNPPLGMTKALVKGMSENDLLDMHYHLSEFDDFDDDDIPFATDFDLSDLCPDCQRKILEKFKLKRN